MLCDEMIQGQLLQLDYQYKITAYPYLLYFFGWKCYYYEVQFGKHGANFIDEVFIVKLIIQ